MTNSFQLFKIGRVFLGLTLVVSLMAAVPAKGDIVCGWDNSAGLYTVEDVITFTYTSGVMLPSGGLNDQAGKLGEWYDYFAGSVQGRSENKAYLEFELLPQHSAPYDFFIVSLKPTANGDAFFDDLIRSMKISTGNGNVPSVGSADFYFASSLVDDDYIRFEFDYGAVPGLAAAIASGVFEISIKGATPTPEPATLAILGLGLAGLGLARRRRK